MYLRNSARQPGLADSGRPDDADHPQALFAAGGMEQVLEEPELLLAADERRLQRFSLVAPATLGDNAQRAPRRDRGLLALERLLTGGLERDGGTGRAMRGLPDQYGPWWRRALQPATRC